MGGVGRVGRFHPWFLSSTSRQVFSCSMSSKTEIRSCEKTAPFAACWSSLLYAEPTAPPGGPQSASPAADAAHHCCIRCSHTRHSNIPYTRRVQTIGRYRVTQQPTHAYTSAVPAECSLFSSCTKVPLVS